VHASQPLPFLRLQLLIIAMIAKKKKKKMIIIKIAMMSRIMMTIRNSDNRAFVLFLRQNLAVMGIAIVITTTATMTITITTTMMKKMTMLIFDDAVDDIDNDDADADGDGNEDASFGSHVFFLATVTKYFTGACLRPGEQTALCMQANHDCHFLSFC
jgi:beta-mannanase